MPRWVLGIVVAPLVLCVICASLGYFVGLPWVRTSFSKGQAAVSKEMEDAVATSVYRRIEASAPTMDRLVLTAADLNVNNADVPGEAGIEVGTEGTWIYGVVTEISPAGVALVLGEAITYSAVPVVEDSRVVLTEVDMSSDLMRLLLSKDGFARGMENGINRGLAAHGLTPTSVTLQHGSMTILTQNAP